MSFQSQLIFPIKKYSEGYSNKSCDFRKQKINVKRPLFQKGSPASKKAKYDENSNRTASKSKRTRDVSSFVVAKQVFHTGQPSRIIGRSKEITEIKNYLNEHIRKSQPASLYISGAPGTGKTSCLMTVIKNLEKEIIYSFVNCMSVSNASDIYTSIAREFQISHSKNVVRALEKYIVTSTSMNVLILDEIDHLDSKGQEILYSLFQWPQLPSSTLILIGIANALDLTGRLLPRLRTFKHEPKLMHFQPYTREQIFEILEDRLSCLQINDVPVIKPVALQLCARKIAACTGDIRKALDVCRRAVEVVQNKRKDQLVLSSTSDDRCNPGSPMKGSSGFCVEISDISAVLNQVYGSRLQSTENSKMVTMPLQQMIILCTLILMKKHCKIQDMNLGKLYDIYKRVCKNKEINSVAEWEFSGLCKLVETRSFVSLKPAKAFRMTKITLKIDESEAEYLLQDKAMLPSILSDTSVLISC